MLQNILKLNGTQKLSKKDQKDISGGFNPLAAPDYSGACSTVCAGAPSGTECGQSTHCPGECDGSGGWWAY